MKRSLFLAMIIAVSASAQSCTKNVDLTGTQLNLPIIPPIPDASCITAVTGAEGYGTGYILTTPRGLGYNANQQFVGFTSPGYMDVNVPMVDNTGRTYTAIIQAQVNGIEKAETTFFTNPWNTYQLNNRYGGNYNNPMLLRVHYIVIGNKESGFLMKWDLTL